MNRTDRAVAGWLRPTRRAIDWTPLTLVTAAILATSVILGWRTIEVPALVQTLGAAGLAAAAVLGLGDPARPLLQALPTATITRLTHRAALLVGATTLAVVTIVIGERLLALSPTAEPNLAAALIALAATGTAVHHTISPTIDHANEAAAGVILLWVAAAAVPVAVLPEVVRVAWLDQPWIVTAAAAVVTLVATTRRSA